MSINEVLSVDGAAQSPELIVLVATVSGREHFLSRALHSIANQTMSADSVVIVGDGTQVDPSVTQRHFQISSFSSVNCLVNQHDTGVANTWNTGILFIAERWPDCYLAILDDDDEWDANHLAHCLETACLSQWPDVVISGLRMYRDGVELPREPMQAACIQDFLAGNPGWQGSNTFIKLTTLLRAGSFTPDLQSCNDRDLAIRVLSLDDVHVAFTGCHTASWHLDSNRTSLSSKGSQTKLDGLAHFYCLHSHRMTASIRQQFFARAVALFGWQEADILQCAREWGRA